MSHQPLLELHRISKYYIRGRKKICALSDITLAIQAGKTVGLAGESGSGKSTLGRLLLSLEAASSGTLWFRGREISTLSRRERHLLKRRMQMVFQDPFSSLDPRMTIRQIIQEGIEIHQLCQGEEKEENVERLLQQVGLPLAFKERYPHELSGGQRQRVGIARAFAVDPEFIVLDEPLSALDICTQKQILELLRSLKAQKQLTYLFISHDLHAIRQIADEVAILYRGKIVEYGPVNELFRAPSHPYTQALLSAAENLR
jgi:ABC-type oligopeptide transport system ATPase subunit